MTGGPPVCQCIFARRQDQNPSAGAGEPAALQLIIATGAGIRNPEHLKGRRSANQPILAAITDYVVRHRVKINLRWATHDVQVIQVGGSQAAGWVGR